MPEVSPDRQAAAGRHRERLARLLADPDVLERELGRAAGRRSPGRRLPDARVARRGRRAVLERADVLLVAVPPGDAGRTARELLDASDVEAEAVDGLRGRVVRVGTEGRSRPRAEALRRSLDAAGVRTSLAQLAPTGVVMKSALTPEAPPDGEPLPGAPGAGERSLPVVVLDTGLALAGRTDGWLAGLEHDGNRDPLDVWPEPNTYLDLSAGHGTFVAGVVQRVDPALDLSVVRVVDSDGLADEVEVATALVAAVEERLEPGGRLVVNLSLGSDTLDDLPPVALEAGLAVVREIEAERGGEVLLVASAGNDGSEDPCWPAAFAATDRRVVAVAATGTDDDPAPWSTHGDWVTCSTLGEAVLSTFVAGREDPDFHEPGDPPATFPGDAWAWWTGTSFAAPQVAALVASHARRTGSTLDDALAAVLAGAVGHAPGYGALLASTN